MQKELIRALALFAALLALLGCFAVAQAADYQWHGSNDAYTLFDGATIVGTYNPTTKTFAGEGWTCRFADGEWVDVPAKKPCSPACTCGCNDGKPCECNKFVASQRAPVSYALPAYFAQGRC